MTMMTKVAMGGLVLVAALTVGPAGDIAAQDASVVRAEIARTISVAVPQESYGWRPGEGVRCVSEVYMHVAGTNYWFPTMVGGTPPASSGVTAAYATVPPMERVTDKEAVVEALRASFDFLVDFVENAPAGRLDEAINMFGTPTTYRGVLVETTIHLHEHLGQSIAYARMNDVTPPWSR
jgi:hypothetical protein